jgi:hypothetical protein
MLASLDGHLLRSVHVIRSGLTYLWDERAAAAVRYSGHPCGPDDPVVCVVKQASVLRLPEPVSCVRPAPASGPPLVALGTVNGKVGSHHAPRSVMVGRLMRHDFGGYDDDGGR